MASKEMQVANSINGDGKSFECECFLSSPANGDWILIPDGIKSISCSLSVSAGGKGKLQTTTDTKEVVETGSSVVAFDWDAGEVSANTQDVCDPVTAIRLVQTFAGTTKLTMRAQ